MICLHNEKSRREMERVMKGLSAKQAVMYRFIRYFTAEMGYAPSMREIQDECGISSTSLVHYNLKGLERKGYIRRTPGVSRGMELAEGRRTKMVRVPVIGLLQAGCPIPQLPRQ